MSNNSKFETQLNSAMDDCNSYMTQLIDYASANYNSAKDLSNYPETLDKFLNYYRARDMCYTFLINANTRHIGYTINDLSDQQIQNLLNQYDPITLFDFFNQPNVLKDFIAENELNQQNWFNNDQQYQKSFKVLKASL